jgi:serine/threonine protein kinase
MAEMNPPYWNLPPMRVLFAIPSNPSPTFKEPEKYSLKLIGFFLFFFCFLSFPFLKTKTHFSFFLKEFLGLCLEKNPAKRPFAAELLAHPWIQSFMVNSAPNLEPMKALVRELDQLPREPRRKKSQELSREIEEEIVKDSEARGSGLTPEEKKMIDNLQKGFEIANSGKSLSLR